ncbi:MAG: hypothetical protein ACJAXJ_001752 [Colwellia sp.]|jgi:hypothetical protein
MNRIKKYLIPAGSILFGMLAVNSAVQADQQIQDDLVVVGSICTGLDCVNGESFGFDTIRLKENNLRIKFMDTSSSSSFPTNDWQITVNDSLNGGANWFGIEDIDAGTTPFTILASAPNESLYVSASGNIGLGTTTPLVDLVIKGGNTPTLRLEQDGTAGFTTQVWDVGGNETNFFVRDVTNDKILPFRIRPNAPNDSIFVDFDGDVGFETDTPDGQFDIAHSANGNNHAFLVSPVSWVGINIDNGFLPKGLFDVQTTGGISRFTIDATGNVGIGTPFPVGRFEVKSTDAATSYFDINAAGLVGIGTNVPTASLHVSGATGTTALMIEENNATTAERTLMTLKNKGASLLAFKNSDKPDETWKVGVGLGRDTNDTTTSVFKVYRHDENAADPLITNVLTLSDAGKLVATEDVCTMKSGSEVCLSSAGGGGSSNSWDPWDIKNDNDVLSFAYNGGSTLLTMDKTGKLVATGDICALDDTKCVGSLKSSKYVKDIYSAVDGADILEKVSSLPISIWSYKVDDNSVLHIGPMAEDFQATFGLNGETTDSIATVDGLGVALTSIQALNNKLKQKDIDIEQLKLEYAQMKEKLASLEAKLNRLLSIQ